jgi:hypothetical protein
MASSRKQDAKNKAPARATAATKVARSQATPRKEDGGFAEQIAGLTATAEQLCQRIEALGFAQLTDEERLHSRGRLREGEVEALESTLDTIDAHPGLFASLAAQDHGKDDSLVETAPAREALVRAAALLPLQQALSRALARVGDEVLASAALTKDVTIPAYAIIKVNAPLSASVRKKAAPALDFHAAKVRPKARPTKA